MLTALILQLLQCMLIVTGRSDRAGSNSPSLENGKGRKKVCTLKIMYDFVLVLTFLKLPLYTSINNEYYEVAIDVSA